jgi:dTDP-4-dehydrorhamnose 3,5-epimerase
VRAAVLGAGGQLGRALLAVLPDVTPFRHQDLDIGDAKAVFAINWGQYDVIVNAAAFTAVDAAESAEGRVAAWRTNAAAVAHLAQAANEHGIPLIHFSSEYVFDGRAEGPITEDEPLSPLSAYGASKAAGDIAAGLAERHYILRTTWVTGDGKNFVRTMLGLAQRGISPTVVSDQVGRLTFADDLAAGVVRLVEAGPGHGVYNVTNSGEPASWAQVARLVFELSGHSADCVSETTTSEYFSDKPDAAARPLNSVLELAKADSVGVHLPHWHDRLTDYVKREQSLR